MAVTYSRRINGYIERFGREATLYTRASSGRNSFNNVEWTFSSDPDGDGTDQTVLCFRTYPNRNTEVQHNSGDRHRDNPVFILPLDEAPDSDARIGYPEPDGSETLYELQAPTKYETHIEIFGEVVVN